MLGGLMSNYSRHAMCDIIAVGMLAAIKQYQFFVSVFLRLNFIEYIYYVLSQISNQHNNLLILWLA